jgi:hypothetical protein
VILCHEMNHPWLMGVLEKDEEEKVERRIHRLRKDKQLTKASAGFSG